MNQYIKDRIKELLLPTFNYKFSFVRDQFEFIQNNIQFMNSRSDGLNLDKYGYSIGPHVDQSHIFAAILIYFPSDNLHAELGTVFYKSLVNRTSIDTTFPSFDEFQPVKKVPFLPNTLVVFLQNPSGWHGVEPITEVDYIRKAYHATISLKPEFTERIYGPNIYRADSLYHSDQRYLNSDNFRGY